MVAVQSVVFGVCRLKGVAGSTLTACGKWRRFNVRYKLSNELIYFR